MRIVAYRTSTRDGKVLLEESTGEFVVGNDIDKLFSFLLEPYDQCIKVCWDLDATVSAFLKLLGGRICRNLKETKCCHKKGEGKYCPLHPLELFYIPDKVFSVSIVSKTAQGLMADLEGRGIPLRVGLEGGIETYAGGRWLLARDTRGRAITVQRANLYGLEQYFPELDEPDVADVQLLGMKLLKELDKMGMRPTKLTSPVAIYEECVLGKLSLPRVKDMPMEVAEMAWRCSGRLWIESHQLGHFI